MAEQRNVQAITFDFWNTLVSESRNSTNADDRTHRWSEALRENGVEASDDEVAAAVDAMWRWFVGEWEHNRVVTPTAAVEFALSQLGHPGDHAAAEAMVAALDTGFDPAEMKIAPGIGKALAELRAAGIKVGIICDVGLTPSSTLRSYLEHHGLMEHFDHWTFSDDVGWYKPDQRMFDHAMAGLGVTDPSAMAHIGDLKRTDVAGAKAAGWTTFRYTGFGADDSELDDADHVIDHHSELVRILVI